MTINSPSGTRTTPLGVQPVAPGIFVVNAQGLAAAIAIRVRAGGEQITEQVVQLSGGQIIPAPIDLGEETDQVLLVLFGTGIRAYSSLSAVRVTLGGVEGVVQYAGPQGEFPGLDQINVFIPRSLRGRGLIDVVVEADGSVGNIVKVQVR